MLKSEQLRNMQAGDTIKITRATAGHITYLPVGTLFTVKVRDDRRFIVDNSGDTLWGVSHDELHANDLVGYSIDLFDGAEFDKQDAVWTAQIHHTDALKLTPLNNGGWTMHILPSSGERMSLNHGAYTNAADLMVGLQDYLENGSD